MDSNLEHDFHFHAMEHEPLGEGEATGKNSTAAIRDDQGPIGEEKSICALAATTSSEPSKAASLVLQRTVDS